MGATLCTCAVGRGDDDPTALGLQRRRLDTAAATTHPPMKLRGSESLLHTQSRAETRELLSDEERVGLHGEYTDGLVAVGLWRRNSEVGTVEAFRHKLREPAMSPRSKFLLLGPTQWSGDDCSSSIEAKPTRTSSGHDSRTQRARSASALYGLDPADDDSREDGRIDSRRLNDDDDEHQDDHDDDGDEYFAFTRIIVPPGPCGVVFQQSATSAPDRSGTPPTVEGFVPMYDGSRGPIENSGLVKRGSVLCAINDLEVLHLPLTEVIRALNLSSHLEREFVFRK